MTAAKKLKIDIEFVSGVGSPFENGEETSVGLALEKHISRHGKIDVEVLLEEIENDQDHPMRRFIEWNEETAARKYRLTQVAKIIRFVRYQVKVDGKIVTPRVFQSVVLTNELPGVAPGRAYVHTSTVVRHETLSNQILERAAKELRQWKERYEIHQAYCELRPMFDAIAAFEAEVGEKLRKPKK